MRLVMLTNDWPPIEGGIATVSRGVGEALARRGHDVTVLAPARPGAEATCRAERGLTIERWRGYDLGVARLVPFLLRALPRLRRFDGVLAMNPAYGGTAAALVRTIGGPPFVAWAYGLELLRARRLGGSLYRYVFRRATAGIAISRYTRDLMLDLGIPSNHIVVLPPGVDPPAASATGSDDPDIRTRLALPPGPIVLSVGRLIARKGFAGPLLTAMAAAIASAPDTQWVIVGRGPEAADLERRVAGLGLTANVHLVGYLPPPELEQLYQAATLFALLPGATRDDAEGFGIVFLEAGARGLPVVATRAGGVVDAVVDGETGILVAPEASGEATAAVLRLLADPDLRRRLGEAGRARAAAHSWDRVAASVETLFAAAPT